MVGVRVREVTEFLSQTETVAEVLGADEVLRSFDAAMEVPHLCRHHTQIKQYLKNKALASYFLAK